MDFLNIDTNTMIDILIKDNKINVVREAILKENFDELIQNERLNYCTDEELAEITENETNLINVISKYKLNEKIITMVLENFIEYTTAIKSIINEYMEILKPQHFEAILKNAKLKSVVMENSLRANDESVIYLHSKNMIPMADERQLAVIVNNDFKNPDIKTLTMEEIFVVAYIKKFTKEELDFVLDKIFEFTSDLQLKGSMDMMLQTQSIPDDVLVKIVTEWEWDLDDTWFYRMLIHQNLDSVIDYILDKGNLSEEAIVHIISNDKTSTKKLIRLYEKYSDIIIGMNPSKLPVLDCHSHMS